MSAFQYKYAKYARDNNEGDNQFNINNNSYLCYINAFSRIIPGVMSSFQSYLYSLTNKE